MRRGQTTVYVFGGTVAETPFSYFGAQAYDLATDTWTEKVGSGPNFLTQTNGLGTIDGKLYVSGGYSYEPYIISSRLLVYDPASNAVTVKAPLPKRSFGGVTGVIHRRLYVLPGYCDGDTWPSADTCPESPIRELFRYDPDTDTWDSLQPAPHVHLNGVGGVIHGKFYVAAGGSSADLDVYDPKTDTWTTLASVPTAGPAVGAVLDGKLYVIMVPHTYAYDPATNTWEGKAPYPTSAPGAVSAVTLHGRRYLLAVGGVHDSSDEYPEGIPNESQLYEP